MVKYYAVIAALLLGLGFLGKAALEQGAKARQSQAALEALGRAVEAQAKQDYKQAKERAAAAQGVRSKTIAVKEAYANSRCVLDPAVRDRLRDAVAAANASGM